MKLLHRLREFVEGRYIEASSGHAGSGVLSLEREKFDTYQTDEAASTLSPIFADEEWGVLGQGGRRRIPDIHEDLPPEGYSIGPDEEGLDPV
jgi:hypothetical protein